MPSSGAEYYVASGQGGGECITKPMRVEANSLMVHNNQGVAKLLPSLTAVSLSHFEFVESLTAVSRSQWSALAINHNPFVSYPFLSALEQSGSVGEGTGWQVHHLLVWGDQRNELVAAVPCYIKQHSYGEYVFDWGWAHAYQRAGLPYYPKMVCAVPFTPATGPRLLIQADCRAQSHAQSPDQRVLANYLIDEAQRLGLSSVHGLFVTEAEAQSLAGSGWMVRHDLQFHWRNDGYDNFDQFIASFASKKRKNVKRERRRVREAGIEMVVVGGAQLTEEQWRLFYRLYRGTAFKRGGTAYLSESFFQQIGSTMADNIVMVFALLGGQPVAAALNFRGGDRLYGRYWGCLAEYDSLHFETCYYAAIDYCIETGIDCYEAGAQGQHKLSRGFMPSTTHSVHWLANPQFSDAVADFLDEERREVAGYDSLLRDHAPFRSEP